MARLRDRYINEIRPQLAQELGRANVMSLPKLDKIVISMGVGAVIQEKTRIEHAYKELMAIAGQAPLKCKAKKSVSNFKLREGMDIGLKVTLRRSRMYEFMDRLISIAIPRVRDFRGLNPRSFDGRGNYHMGLTEQTVFPEVNPDTVEFQQGMNITFCTTAKNDTEAMLLLKLMGMPFRTKEAAAGAA
jgi:large subunit ribosomal protein L5